MGSFANRRFLVMIGRQKSWWVRRHLGGQRWRAERVFGLFVTWATEPALRGSDRIRVNGSSYPSSIPVSAELSPLIDSGPIQTGRAGQERALTFQIGHTEPGAKSHLVALNSGRRGPCCACFRNGRRGGLMPGGDPFPRATSPRVSRQGGSQARHPVWTAYLKSCILTYPFEPRLKHGFW